MHGMTLGGWAVAALAAALVGCGGGNGGTAGATESGSTGDGSTTQTSAPQTSSSGVSDSEDPTTGASGMSMSGTGSTGETTSPTTGLTSTSASDTSTTSATSETSTTDDTGTTIGVSFSDTGTDTGTSTDTGAESSTGDAESSTGPGCIPSPEVCNDLDDDCDDQIDNVDVGKDGICDCLNIALVGLKGSNPNAEFEAWLEAQGTEVDRINTMVAEPLDKATLNKYDIVILDRLVRNYTVDEQSAVQNWIEAGGGLMSLTGYTGQAIDVDRPNSLIKPMGLSYNNSKGILNGPIKMFAPHEITMGLTSVTFLGGFYLNIVEDGVGKNQIIMTLPAGPVGVVQERLGGRMFIFGDEWIEFDSEWKNLPEIKKLWVQSLAYLGPKESCQVPQ